jgi:transmembrane sensor
VSRLKLPLKELLQDPADETALRRIWARIDDRTSVTRRYRRRAAVLGVAFMTATAVAIVSNVRRDDGPLRLEDGRQLVAVDTHAAGATVSLSDHSRIELGADSRFDPLESSGTTFVASLERGSATFDIRPGGPRRWQIECGLATVEVIGTRFACDRGPGRLRVSVERGAVLVRGEHVVGRTRRLAAGESLDVVEDPAPPPALVPMARSSSLDGVAQPAGGAPRDDARSWRELAREGHNPEAFAVLGRQGFHREARRLGVADLLALADVARLSGHPAEAVVPLARVLENFERDPQAPLAAFALGRLELDALNRPKRAVAAFERALALGIPRSLEEDLRARLVEAHARAGDTAAVRDAARAYLRAFPSGRYRTEMETRAAPN